MMRFGFKLFETKRQQMAHDDARNLEPGNLTNEELAYLAGFFDGEGSVTIHENFRPSPRGKSPNHTLQVAIGNTDPRILAWVHSVFGGSLQFRPSTKPRHRDITMWILRSNGAARFLRTIRPFLRMKCEQTDVALSFQAEKGRYRRSQLTPEEIEFRESKRMAIRLLNGRNVA
jgi:hypothetical protein